MVTSSLVTSGIGPECIFEENFDLSSNEARDLSEVGDLHPQEVVVNWQGHAHHFRVAAGATILESALGQDIALPYSCKRGVCSACMGHLLKGKVAMARQDVLLEFEVEKGLLLLCQAYPLSENVEVEVGF
jgi:ring-1,2-phenylacetyl-CoA epoxidase subunit PaaE